MTAAASLFDGPEYQPVRDNLRLLDQIGRVYHVMSDGRWRTLAEAATATTALRTSGHDPEASISAQLRHLRKPRWGSHTVERRGRDSSDSLFEYRLIPSEGGLRHLPPEPAVSVSVADRFRQYTDEIAELRQWQADACELIHELRGSGSAWVWFTDDAVVDLLRRAENP